jgi:hypothetical protein
MTKGASNPNDELLLPTGVGYGSSLMLCNSQGLSLSGEARGPTGFGLRHSFVIRHSA